MFFFPVKVIWLIILGSPWRIVRGVVRLVLRGVVRRVVRGAGSVGSPRIGGQSFLLSLLPAEFLQLVRIFKRLTLCRDHSFFQLFLICL